MSPKVHIWLKGGVAAGLSGCFGGIATAFTVGAGHITPRVILSAMGINAVVGIAAYLKQSPLPNGGAQ